MKKAPILTVMLASACIAALAGCTTTSTDTSTPGKSPKAATTPTASAEDTFHGNECKDGQAIMYGNGKNLSLPKGCDTVSVVGTAKSVTLGPVKHLTVEGDGTTVTVESVDDILLAGQNNTVIHGGSPKVDDQGKNNSLKAR